MSVTTENSQKRIVHKSTRFGTEIEVRHFEPFGNELSGDLWYSDDEYSNFERENSRLAWKLINGIIIDENVNSARGLETEDPMVARRRYERTQWMTHKTNKSTNSVLVFVK